jgi:hypothetical protein
MNVHKIDVEYPKYILKKLIKYWIKKKILYEKMSLGTPYSLDLFQIYTNLCFYNRVIRKVRKTKKYDFKDNL